MTPEQKLLEAIFGGADPTVLHSRDESFSPLMITIRGSELTLTQADHLREMGEARRPEDCDIVIIARDQARALIAVLQGFIDAEEKKQ